MYDEIIHELYVRGLSHIQVDNHGIDLNIYIIYSNFDKHHYKDFHRAQCTEHAPLPLDNLWRFSSSSRKYSPGRVAQSVTCLATDAFLTADLGVASSIPVQSHTFVEIDHEIISTVILLPSADLFKKVYCQLQAKVCARITG